LTVEDEAVGVGLETAFFADLTGVVFLDAAAVLRGGLVGTLVVVFDADDAVGRIMRARNPWSTSFSLFIGG
jgi:hypothetical protein